MSLRHSIACLELGFWLACNSKLCCLDALRALPGQPSRVSGALGWTELLSNHFVDARPTCCLSVKCSNYIGSHVYSILGPRLAMICKPVLPQQTQGQPISVSGFSEKCPLAGRFATGLLGVREGLYFSVEDILEHPTTCRFLFDFSGVIA